MNRTETLEAALHAVTDRGATYGKPEDVFGMIADLWTAYLGGRLDAPLTGFDVSQLMILLKVARAKNNPHHTDNHVDIAGYAGCANELAERLQTAPVEPAAPSVEKLPLVPEFLRDGVQRGDSLIIGCDESPTHVVETLLYVLPHELVENPVLTSVGRMLTLDGYMLSAYTGKKNGVHVLRIKRDGVTVAEGQVYDE